jgi:2-(1,2-epoxy-1,2-dihydrophenyl)acetyl-CoA isomerase
MNYGCIDFTRDGGFATITLNQPETLNALSLPLLTELRHALDGVATDESVRAVILTGNGRAFSSGANLSEDATAGDFTSLDLGKLLDEYYVPVILRLRRLEKPVICAVNGVAAGAGMSLALAGDIVLAARSAQFIQIFTKIGVIPDAGSTFFLPRLVGTARALGLALLREPLSAEQAEQWGLIWRCVEDGSLMAEAGRLAGHFATEPTRALGLTKRAIQASLNNTLAEQLDLESALQRVAGKTEDFAEGVTAFLEKRPARFTGR